MAYFFLLGITFPSSRNYAFYYSSGGRCQVNINSGLGQDWAQTQAWSIMEPQFLHHQLLVQEWSVHISRASESQFLGFLHLGSLRLDSVIFYWLKLWDIKLRIFWLLCSPPNGKSKSAPRERYLKPISRKEPKRWVQMPHECLVPIVSDAKLSEQYSDSGNTPTIVWW